MPESAELRKLHRDIGPCVGHRVRATRIVSGRYTRAPIAGFDKLTGYTIDSVGIKGKLLVFQFKPPTEMGIRLAGLSTLGLTGWWDVFANPIPQDLPKHSRLIIDLGIRWLVYTDPRNFGTFKLTTLAAMHKKLKELGPDIASHIAVPAEFWLRLERYGKKKTIAEVMLDQRIFCGVGNYIRADAMYLSRIDPRTPANEVTKGRLGLLWHNCHVISNAAFHDAHPTDSNRFFINVCYGRQVDEHGNPIESYEDSNGRTVWWCPKMQARL